MNFEFLVSDIVKEKIAGLKLGALWTKNVTVQKNAAQFDDEFQKLASFLQTKFEQQRPAEDEVVSYVRRMYRRIGWEPTRYRPSSEALIRRILKGNSLYRINNLVDFGNLASARFHIPMGLYDGAKIDGPIILDVGIEGEAYQGISNPEIHAAGKLILRDDSGIFGNPTADSLRTSITESTNSALALFFCPPELNDNYITDTLKYLADFYTTFSEKVAVHQEIIHL